VTPTVEILAVLSLNRVLGITHLLGCYGYDERAMTKPFCMKLRRVSSSFGPLFPRAFLDSGLFHPRDLTP
jgi:hypothetical protein